MPTLREQKKQRTQAAISAAALRLFAERGFEAVPLADVAAAADVGERTLFRYFPDKEELLFGEDEAMRAGLAEALASRPLDEPPAAALAAASRAVSARLGDRRREIAARAAVIAASPRLQARERAKHAGYEEVLAAGLAERGVPGPRARLLARVTVACFDEGMARWLEDPDPRRPGLAARVEDTFAELPGLLG